MNDELHLITFKSIAKRFIEAQGYTPKVCSSEDEARSMTNEFISQKMWPCYFSSSTTTGEKTFEEFYRKDEKTDMDRFIDLGIVKSELNANTIQLNDFLNQLELLKKRAWQKEEMVKLFQSLLPEFKHIEKERSLDQKM